MSADRCPGARRSTPRGPGGRLASPRYPGTRPSTGRRGDGYSLVELTVALVLASIILSSVGAALLDQRRFYTSQTRIVDTRDAVRVGLELLSRELREASPSQDDLYAIGPDSIALRGFRGFGVLCDRDGTRLRVWAVSGAFGDAGHDSVMIYRENLPETAADDGWLTAGAVEVRKLEPADCLGEVRPRMRITLDRDPGAIPSGTPVRAFRPLVYRLYRADDGHWWLGQRPRGSAIQPAAGPFEPPESGGLRFEYLTRDGAAAGAPDEVARVRIHLKARSALPLPLPRDAGHYNDGLTTAVFLRNTTQ